MSSQSQSIVLTEMMKLSLDLRCFCHFLLVVCGEMQRGSFSEKRTRLINSQIDTRDDASFLLNRYWLLDFNLI